MAAMPLYCGWAITLTAWQTSTSRPTAMPLSLTLDLTGEVGHPTWSLGWDKGCTRRGGVSGTRVAPHILSPGPILAVG